MDGQADKHKKVEKHVYYAADATKQVHKRGMNIRRGAKTNQVEWFS